MAEEASIFAAAGWDPDVALVNYYREGDTLGGHRDDVEQDQTAPIVSISLGCDAIFLLGGDDPPLNSPYCTSALHAGRQHWSQHAFHSHPALSIACSRSARSLCATHSVVTIAAAP